MGTVSAASITRINDAEGALTSVSVGGGAGAAANTDIFIQGNQSLGRRQSNVVLGGFLLTDATDNNLSAAGTHVGLWIWVTHYAVLTALRVRLAENTSTNYDEHIVPLTEYPALGGWVRVWVEVARTPDATGGAGLNETIVRNFGPIVSLPTVGGNAANLILDAIDSTTTGLSLTGTNGLWSDFVTADEGNATNKYGVISSISGILYVRARLTLGTATSLVFSDSNFTLVFPQQNLVATSFMGITVDLQNASTSVTWSAGSIQSPGTKKGDLIVTGTAGIMSVTGCAFTGLRALTLTSKVTCTSTTFTGCGLITLAGATLTGCTVNAPSGAVGILAANPSTISSTAFISKGTGHAIEISTPGTYTFTGNTFSGFAATNGATGNEAVYNNSGGLVTLNVAGGGGTPSIRNGAGASTVINNNKSVTLTGLRDNTEVRVYTAGTTTELAGIEDATAGTVDARTFTFALAAGTLIDIRIHNKTYEPVALTSFEVPNNDSSIPISQRFDRNYSNP